MIKTYQFKLDNGTILITATPDKSIIITVLSEINVETEIITMSSFAEEILNIEYYYYHVMFNNQLLELSIKDTIVLLSRPEVKAFTLLLKEIYYKTWKEENNE